MALWGVVISTAAQPNASTRPAFAAWLPYTTLAAIQPYLLLRLLCVSDTQHMPCPCSAATRCTTAVTPRLPSRLCTYRQLLKRHHLGRRKKCPHRQGVPCAVSWITKAGWCSPAAQMGCWHGNDRAMCWWPMWWWLNIYHVAHGLVNGSSASRQRSINHQQRIVLRGRSKGQRARPGSQHHDYCVCGCGVLKVCRSRQGKVQVRNQQALLQHETVPAVHLIRTWEPVEPALA